MQDAKSEWALREARKRRNVRARTEPAAVAGGSEVGEWRAPSVRILQAAWRLAAAHTVAAPPPTGAGSVALAERRFPQAPAPKNVTSTTCIGKEVL
jgi:hypothetical protein